MTDLVIKNPDGSYATTDATNLKGHNWHKTIRASDGTIPEEDIKRYYDIVMKMDWQDGWYGETIFYDPDDINNIAYTSPYTPGRFILFDGSIPHTIRPQSIKAPKFRLSLSIFFEK